MKEAVYYHVRISLKHAKENLFISILERISSYCSSESVTTSSSDVVPESIWQSRVCHPFQTIQYYKNIDKEIYTKDEKHTAQNLK